MQLHLRVTPGARSLYQGSQQHTAPLGTAHGPVYRHAPDAAHARGLLQQPARSHRLPQAVVEHRVARAGIQRVCFHIGGYALFAHKHRRAQAGGIAAQRIPVTRAHFDHLGTGLEPLQHRPQRRRHRGGCLSGWVGKHIDQFASDQQAVATENGRFKQAG